MSIIHIYIYIYIYTLEHFLQANQISYLQQQLEMMTQTRAHESTYAGQQIQQLGHKELRDYGGKKNTRRDTHSDARMVGGQHKRKKDRSKQCVLSQLECLFSRSPGQSPSGTKPACAKRATEMVHGRARAPPRQTWRVAVNEGR